MIRIIGTICLAWYFVSTAVADSLTVKADTLPRMDTFRVVQSNAAFTLHKSHSLLTKYPPFVDFSNHRVILRNQQAPFAQKVLRGCGLVFAAQGITVGLLFALPERTSNWDRSALGNFGNNIKEAFRQPPVIDGDKWYINYIGHPYQGACYYNAYRSQGAKIWQASLFCVGHSVMWEYLIESGFERPSIQDLIVTPCAGILLGELFHFASVRMSRNGFTWYEAAFVSVFNPMYAINNGFRRVKQK